MMCLLEKKVEETTQDKEVARKRGDKMKQAYWDYEEVAILERWSGVRRQLTTKAWARRRVRVSLSRKGMDLVDQVIAVLIISFLF
jgi:hypothetical protein